MKVTIAIDDISLPLPPMRTPDVRQQVLEVILPLLEESGVDDVHLVVAIALHRRMTEAEMKRMVRGLVLWMFSTRTVPLSGGLPPVGF